MSMIIQKPKPLYEQVYETIRASILSGRFPKDERLNEVHIAQELEVSRGPVRESMRRLEQEGLIVRDSKNQLFIYKASVEDLTHIYQCRAVLESYAAKLASINGTKTECNKLEIIMDETKSLQGCTDDLSKERLILLNGQFHDTIVSMSRNPRLEQQIFQLRSLTYFYRAQNVKGEGRRKQIYSDHLAIYQSICSQKDEESSYLMTTHIERDVQHLISIIKEETA